MGATWDMEHDDRRRFRRMLLASGIAHATLLVVLAAAPQGSQPLDLSAAITVDLLAAPGPPPAAKAAAVAKAPAPKPPAPPAAKAEPVPPPPTAEPVPPPPPPPPKPSTTVLPKEAVKAPEQVKPTPPVPQPVAKPAAKPAPQPQKQASIDDVLSQLRAEAGETDPAPIEEARVDPSDLAAADVTGTGGGGGSVKVSPEVMAWLKSARIHVRKSWVLSAGFRLEPLAAQIRVNLDAAGNVLGEPEVVRRSGNPWYDESVLRAIQKASPLPAPPRAGEWDFLFQPDET